MSDPIMETGVSPVGNVGQANEWFESIVQPLYP